MKLIFFQFSSVAQSCWLFMTPWTAARKASLSITNSQTLLNLMSIESVMPPNHLIFCHPPSPRVCNLSQYHGLFQWVSSSNESVLRIRWPNIATSVSASILPMNIHDWFPLGLTGLISLKSQGHLRVFSNTTVQKHQFFGAQLSL